MTALRVTSVAFTDAAASDTRTGLVGWVTCIVNNGLVLDSLAVRKTACGRFALSFPARRDRRGRDHPYFRPLDDGVRRSIEEQVFAQLGIPPEEPVG